MQVSPPQNKNSTAVRARPQLHGSVDDEHQHKVAGLVVITEEPREERLAGERRMVERRFAEPRMVEIAAPPSSAW
jgi:hypothetical protein